ncbi:hypothetical protein RM151_11495 [Pantoea agglomerans]|uniref:hypothetical protein n=1 Tax=Enterobacter agglomerans TaxID=549 RepID=UPI002896781C|nr:hypothetical protein [Pantoea agglomerans]WNK56721.1 hypothetical protein RM151_11495 [Pantoea agglomerans]
MSLLQDLKNKLQPKLTKVTVGDDIELYVRKPTLAKFEECKDTKSTLIHCVCRDETGYPAFSDGGSDDTIDINEIDASIASELFQHCLNLWSTEDSPTEEFEKK